MMEVWLILLVGGLIFFGLLVLLLVLYKSGYMQRLPMWTGLGYSEDPRLSRKVYEKVQIADETQEAQTRKHIVTHESQPGKTLWDWLQLLLIPVVLAIVAFSFNAGQESMNQRLEQQRRQEQIVDIYLDRMSNLLLQYHLHDSQLGDPIRATAQAITLTALDRLDTEYKRIVVLFLYRADLITYHFEKKEPKDKPIITLPFAALEGAKLNGVYLCSADLHNMLLSGANFHGSWLEQADLGDSNADHADLSNTFMRAANLYHTNLTDANLQGAILREANIPGAFLSRAQLSHADLWKANLGVYNPTGHQKSYTQLDDADLTGANLTNADLTGANLYHAKVSWKQLAKAKSLAGAIMPDGTKHP